MDAKSINGGSIQTRKYVKLGYHYLISHLLKLLLVPLMAVLVTNVSLLSLNQLYLHFLQNNLVGFIFIITVAIFGFVIFLISKPRSVYLLDYSCYLPPSNLKVSYKKFMDRSKLIKDFNESSLDFQRKIMERSGLGEETYLPESLHCIPPRTTMAAAREEAEQVIRASPMFSDVPRKIKKKKCVFLVDFVNEILFVPKKLNM